MRYNLAICPLKGATCFLRLDGCVTLIEHHSEAVVAAPILHIGLIVHLFV
jgi:hypothetical protein